MHPGGRTNFSTTPAVIGNTFSYIVQNDTVYPLDIFFIGVCCSWPFWSESSSGGVRQFSNPLNNFLVVKNKGTYLHKWLHTLRELMLSKRASKTGNLWRHSIQIYRFQRNTDNMSSFKSCVTKYIYFINVKLDIRLLGVCAPMFYGELRHLCADNTHIKILFAEQMIYRSLFKRQGL